MADEPKQKPPQDAQRINLTEDDAVRYWTKKFHVSEHKLKSAISRVGPGVKQVKRELGTQ